MYADALKNLKENISKVLMGKDEQLELLLVALVSEGHILIEDVPGVGKTMLAKSLAASLNSEFHRLQCTPDLTPTDVTGFNVYDRQSNSFAYRPGPVVTNILLVDEINRAVPRTQSSLLEAMEERQVTVDGQTIKLPQPFLVVATQNPIEHEGTFPLPEAQLDRFLLKLSIGYPDAEVEEKILLTHGVFDQLASIGAVADSKDVLEWQQASHKIFVHKTVIHYIVEIIRATRCSPSVVFGASPRASLALFKAARSLAMLRGRSYVIPDDVKYMAPFVLVHRLSLQRSERLRGNSGKEILDEVLSTVPVPIEMNGE